MEKSDSEVSEQGEMNIIKHVYTDQENFLNDIFLQFLENVHPIESGLMDDFRAGGIMSSDEEHEIRAQVTRRDGARKLWSLLHRVPPGLFEKSCYPAMKRQYSHLFNELSFCWDGQGDVGDQCLRHAIMTRMTMRRFADVFPPTKGCTHAEYCKIAECSDPDDTMWDFVFKLCAKNKVNEGFCEMMKKTLQNIGVEIPENFSAMLSSGFPCTFQCQTPRSRRRRSVRRKTKAAEKSRAPLHATGATSVNLDRQVDSDKMFHLNEFMFQEQLRICGEAQHPCVSSCGYPSTTDDRNDDEGHSMSLSSHATADQGDDEIQEIQFETREQKDQFLHELETINTAMKKASAVRPLSRELAGIKDEMKILRATVKSETAKDFDFLVQGKLLSLLKRASDLSGELQRNFQVASRVLGNADFDTSNEIDTELPFTHRKVLLQKRRLLDNEAKEAKYFFQYAQSVLKDECFRHMQSWQHHRPRFVDRRNTRKEFIMTMGDKMKGFSNIYVENLADEFDDDKLRELFANYVKIISAKVMVGDDGKSRGLGFVSFEEPEGAEKAVEAINGTKVDGRTICCGLAQKYDECQAELTDGFKKIMMESINRYQGAVLYVKNLDDSIDDERLRKEFSQFGTIISAKIMTEGGRSKGFGFVCFSSPEEATKAVTEMNGRIIVAKPLYVALAQGKEDHRAQKASRYRQYMAKLRQQQSAQYSQMFQSGPAGNFFIPAMAQTLSRFYAPHAEQMPMRTGLYWNTLVRPVQHAAGFQSIPPTQMHAPERPIWQVSSAPYCWSPWS